MRPLPAMAAMICLPWKRPFSMKISEALLPPTTTPYATFGCSRGRCQLCFEPGGKYGQGANHNDSGTHNPPCETKHGESREIGEHHELFGRLDCGKHGVGLGSSEKHTLKVSKNTEECQFISGT